MMTGKTVLMRIPVTRRPATKAVPTYPVAEVTGENEESNSKESINEDIDAWTASRPTKPNPTTAATTLKLNSKKTNTDLAQEEDQTEKKPPDDTSKNEEATKNKAEWEDCLSDKPADGAPTNNGGTIVTTKEEDEPIDDNDTERKDVISREPDYDPPTADGDAATTIGELDKPSDEPPTITENSESKEPPTRSHIIDVGDADTSEEEMDEPNVEPAKITPMHEEEVPEVTTDAEETTEEDAQWKEDKSLTTGSSSVHEATVVVNEEWFEVDDALSVPPRAS
jgi:hypothetical protein